MGQPIAGSNPALSASAATAGYACRVTPRPSPIDAAFRRMLDADDRKNADRTDNEAWDAWQRAATDYWVLRHPEIARYRRGDPTRTPTVAEFRDLAELVSRAMDGIPHDWRLQPASSEKAERLARVGWFHELGTALYGPVISALERAPHDPAAVETLVRFLEADVYCFRSGYLKADVCDAIKRLELDPPTTRRLRAVVLAVVDSWDRREFRAYCRLARAVDGEDLRAALRDRLTWSKPHVPRRARWVLEAIGERPTSLASRRGR